jgi:branched-chain amino acid transport system substrate-binding protein
MKTRIFTLLGLLVIAGLLLAACAPQPAAPDPTPPPGDVPTPPPPDVPFTPPDDPIGVVTIPPGDPMHIGFWGVISGPDASLGEDSRRGVQIAMDDRGNELLGRPIQLTSEDAGCNAEGGTAAATRLSVDTSIVGLVGSNCSSEASAGVPILCEAGMATVSMSNTAPPFTDPDQRGPGGVLENTFACYLRTAHSDAVQGRVAALFAYEELGLRTAATIHDGSVYAEALQQVFADTFRELGGTITSQEAVGPTDVDMRPVLTRIAADQPEIIYHPIFIAAGGHVVSQSREIAGLEDVVLMGADGTFSADFVAAAGAAAEGVYLSSPDVTAFTERYDHFLEKHRQLFGEEPLSIFHAHAYDAAEILFQAIERAAVVGPDGTIYVGRQALRDELFATRNYPGMIGALSCDQYGDCSAPVIAVYQVTERELGGPWPPEAPVWVPEQ